MSLRNIKTPSIDTPQHSQTSVKKPYKTPKLKGFGTVIELTASGSANGTESGMGPNKIKP